MSKEGNIQTFLRIRPSKYASGYFNVDDLNPDCLAVTLPEGGSSGGTKEYINNTKSKYGFQFNGILPMSATQDEVFKKVGQAAVNNVLDGFNSTIFAYGQTGSGKTFTLTGGPERYADRGIIPRAISMLYNEFRTKTDSQFKAYISYLEIYNERGYDLLDPSHQTKALEDLPKVNLLEDEHGNFHLKNLSMHVADTEEDALNLLFMGDTNRAIAETPMNMASSRSHCIFSISLEARDVSSDKVRRSKLHLVDLAGSERVGKTNSSGSVLQEARYINGSLFFLEMVIVALYEKATKGRTHVPYRNSMMTSVLRDSLGGNCKTIMIATINPEAAHSEESLSTCRFAQRVSLIKNKASINEDLDPLQLIRRLKAELLNLREEISFLKGENSDEEQILTPSETEELMNNVRIYMNDPDQRAILNIGKLTLTKIKDVFVMMKNVYLECKSNGGNSSSSNEDMISVKGKGNEELMKQVSDLKGCLLQRDNEIAILVNMVKKGKTAEDVVASRQGSRVSGRDTSSHDNQDHNTATSSPIRPKNNNQSATTTTVSVTAAPKNPTPAPVAYMFGIPPPSDASIFEDAAASYEYFSKKCSTANAMEENREILKEKITEAKIMGERANQSRSTITYLKNSIEAIRREKALQNMTNDKKQDDTIGGNNDGSIDDESPEEATYRRAIEQEKTVYKESFEKLRVLKPEIEHIRKILEKSRVTMQNQFDQWYNHLHTMSHHMQSKPSEAKVTQYSNNSMVSSSNRSGVTSNESMIANSKDEDINEDIMAFYQAKEDLLKRRAGSLKQSL